MPKLTIVVPQSLFDELTRIGEEDVRSAEGQALYFIKVAVAQRAKEPPRDTGDLIPTPLPSIQQVTSAGIQVELPEMGPSSKSGYFGVYPYGKAKWCAKISVDGRQNIIGRYNTPEEAARAYDNLARQLGRTDRINFPNEEELKERRAWQTALDDDPIKFAAHVNAMAAARLNLPTPVPVYSEEEIEAMLHEEAASALMK